MIEEKFEFNYNTGNLEFNYQQDELDSYITELDESAFVVDYYVNGEAIELQKSFYELLVIYSITH